jgi:hypothetical protein
VAIDPMLAASIIDGVEAGDRTADTLHPEIEEDADGPGIAMHDVINGHVRCNGMKTGEHFTRAYAPRRASSLRWLKFTSDGGWPAAKDGSGAQRPGEDFEGSSTRS